MYEEFLEELKLYFGKDYSDSQEDFVLSLIEDAINEIVDIMYPYEIPEEKLDEARMSAFKRYKTKIRRIVEYHYDKQGKEGVTMWSENNTSAHYENSGTPASYLRGIHPVARII